SQPPTPRPHSTPPPPLSPLPPYTTLFRSQTAAADGHHHRAHLPAVLGAQLVRGLERDGALTGHDHRMVEGRDQGRAGAVRVLCRSEEHTSELQSREKLVCRLLLEKKKKPQ